MVKTRRVMRWITGVAGAGCLLQAGTCAINDPQVQQQITNQLVLPQAASLLSDIVFFFLDNALVHLTT